jgi:hypothetical protein
MDMEDRGLQKLREQFMLQVLSEQSTCVAPYGRRFELEHEQIKFSDLPQPAWQHREKFESTQQSKDDQGTSVPAIVAPQQHPYTHYVCGWASLP